ncbi:hypothetical protein C4552_00600 [Candidatus Parcubacteria bacterium]|nr:MAG: hypothetical protein C4552_00600 [Candidatus Parcubacteria bacterium]
MACTGEAARNHMNRMLLSEAANGDSWWVTKLSTLMGGDKFPAHVCDETLLVHLDKDHMVRQVQSLNPKTCVGENSLKNALVGTVVPAALFAGGQIGAAALLRPATTRINANESLTVTGVGGDVSPQQATDAALSVDQQQQQGQGQDQRSTATGGAARADSNAKSNADAKGGSATSKAQSPVDVRSSTNVRTNATNSNRNANTNKNANQADAAGYGGHATSNPTQHVTSPSPRRHGPRGGWR